MTAVWLNGGLLAGTEATVSVFDHGLLYGDGVFEGLRCVAGRVVDWDRHLARLHVSARALHLSLPSDGMLWEATRACCVAEGRDTYLRLVVTRGSGRLGLDPSSCPQTTLFCIADDLELFGSKGGHGNGIHLATASRRRPPSDVLDPRVKSLNYLNNVLSKVEAKQRGADDALLLNQQGNVAEASAANLFLRLDDELVTPPTTDGALDGITRRRVLQVAREMGVACAERSLSRIDLFRAREVFITGTGAGLVPVARFDGETVGAERGLFERVSRACASYVQTQGRLLAS